MIKSVLREICIILLLCVAIVLILGVVFYDYIPSNKAVPNKLSTYVTPENVQQEIEEKVTETEKESVTYTITGADLNLYKQTNSYVSGKPDPFSASTDISEPNNGGSPNANENNQGNGSNISTTEPITNNTVDPNSTGTFFNNTGLK